MNQQPEQPGANAGVRGAIRGLAAALVTAVTLTVLEVYPDVPEALIATWGGVFLGAIGVGEAIYDWRRGRG